MIMTKTEGLLQQLNTLGMEDIATLSYALGSEPHHPNMIMVGGHGGLLEIERDTRSEMDEKPA